MNKIKAIVEDIVNVENLNVVKFKYFNHVLSMVSLELDNINIQDTVILTTKATNIAIGKNLNGKLSFCNQLKGRILKINNGEILTSLDIQIENTILQSIITKNSSKRLDLNLNDEVIALIKASDLSILEVENGN